jgi:putative MATE family efflux protein
LNAPHAKPRAVFTEGPIMRHVLVMTGAGSVGLIAIFLVDFLSLLYVSWLGDPKLTAGVGYATQILFFSTSLGIGLSIAIGAIVSRALGAGDRRRAQQLASSGLVHVAVISALASFAALPYRHDLLMLLGARGAALEVASTFLLITLPANVLLGLGMALSGILRAVGDARRAMWVTLAGGIVTAIADPLFIFVFGFGVNGAAMATVVARIVFFAVGWYGAVYVHGLVARPQRKAIISDLKPMMVVALPVILTNMASPVAQAYAMRVFSAFGEPIVAAFAMIDRITPLAFGVLFALTGSVGPIMGQNLGARVFDRVRRTLTDCMTITGIYVVFMWLVLWLIAPFIVKIFGATGDTARLVTFFCTWGATLWLFLGQLFVANAAFNNLGFPLLATLFNWGRATLGTIPFVTYGAANYGPEGGLIGMVVGAALFGTISIVTAFFVTGRLIRKAQLTPPQG